MPRARASARSWPPLGWLVGAVRGVGKAWGFVQALRQDGVGGWVGSVPQPSTGLGLGFGEGRGEGCGEVHEGGPQAVDRGRQASGVEGQGLFAEGLFCLFSDPGRAQDSLEWGLWGIGAFADLRPLSGLADALLGREEDIDEHACGGIQFPHEPPSPVGVVPGRDVNGGPPSRFSASRSSCCSS